MMKTLNLLISYVAGYMGGFVLFMFLCLLVGVLTACVIV